MVDKIFGEMSFHVGWTKREVLQFDKECYNVRIRTSSLKDELPTDLQRSAYLHFEEKAAHIFEMADSQIRAFIESHREEISEQLGVTGVDSYSKVLTPFEVLFFKNGKYAILFETRWSEGDMCILCEGDRIVVDEGEILEFEE